MDLKAMLDAQKADSLAAMSAADLAAERSDAMDYYLGDMSKDMPAQDGRSKAVSTDVADTIEGLMPNLMDIFAGSDEVVRFEPVGPEDEEAAQQETDYVNHVFMQQNPGFMVLYSFIKDALLSKVGIVKVWWEESEQEERETYYDLTDDQFALLAQAVAASGGMMKIVEHSVNGEGDAPTSNPEYEATS
ncbi:portal protein [Bradyrhizobium sp. AZCC 1578]|uniref:portal protein n=1 Tax=Bradyrhizobium sp. AZCC 1578 TaxID=3117027 RepID=UPI002FF0E293